MDAGLRVIPSQNALHAVHKLEYLRDDKLSIDQKRVDLLYLQAQISTRLAQLKELEKTLKE